MLPNLEFKSAENIVTGNTSFQWSDETIETLVYRRIKLQSGQQMLRVPIIESIALVGAVTSPDGRLNQRDKDYIEAFFEELMKAGMPICSNLSVTNYNLKDGTDIFDRNAPVDALLVCHLNTMPSKKDADKAPIYSGAMDEDDHYFHISGKSTTPMAWVQLAQRLEVKIAAAYGWGRAVSIRDFSSGEVSFGFLSTYESINAPCRFERWRQETGGEWKAYKKMTPDELYEWDKHSSSYKAPSIIQDSDMAVCEGIKLNNHYSMHLVGQSGLLYFAISRGLLDIASDPRRSSKDLLDRLRFENVENFEPKSVLADKIVRYSWGRPRPQNSLNHSRKDDLVAS